MARVFTTRFAFNHQMYNAIVTISSIQGQLQYAVRLMDPELLHLLPAGHLNYTEKEGFTQVPPGNHLAASLMQCIAGSVERHLNVLP